MFELPLRSQHRQRCLEQRTDDCRSHAHDDLLPLMRGQGLGHWSCFAYGRAQRVVQTPHSPCSHSL